MTVWVKTTAILPSAACCLAPNSAYAVSCEVDSLTTIWLGKHIKIQDLLERFPDAIRAMRDNNPDPDYKPENFGGEPAKKAFKEVMINAEAALDTAVKTAALTSKPPCYVCLIRSNYASATEAESTCAKLLKTVSQRPDLSDLVGTFNCDKLKDITRRDMENPELDEDYWKRVHTRQDVLE